MTLPSPSKRSEAYPLGADALTFRVFSRSKEFLQRPSAPALDQEIQRKRKRDENEETRPEFMDGMKITNQERGNEVGDRRRYAHNYRKPPVDAPVPLLLPIGQVAYHVDTQGRLACPDNWSLSARHAQLDANSQNCGQATLCGRFSRSEHGRPSRSDGAPIGRKATHTTASVPHIYECCGH